MGILSGIGDAIKGAVDTVSDVAGAFGGISDLLGGVMDSPLGGLIAAAFPPAGAVTASLQMFDMAATIADQVGGGETY